MFLFFLISFINSLSPSTLLDESISLLELKKTDGITRFKTQPLVQFIQSNLGCYSSDEQEKKMTSIVESLSNFQFSGSPYRCLVELINNSIDHSDDKGECHVDTTIEDNYSCIKTRDFGKGMDLDDITQFLLRPYSSSNDFLLSNEQTSSQTGRFGMGYFSHLSLILADPSPDAFSETITRKEGSNITYRVVLSKSKTQGQLLDISISEMTVDDSNYLKETGTEVSLHLSTLPTDSRFEELSPQEAIESTLKEYLYYRENGFIFLNDQQVNLGNNSLQILQSSSDNPDETIRSRLGVFQRKEDTPSRIIYLVNGTTIETQEIISHGGYNIVIDLPPFFPLSSDRETIDFHSVESKHILSHVGENLFQLLMEKENFTLINLLRNQWFAFGMYQPVVKGITQYLESHPEIQVTPLASIDQVGSITSSTDKIPIHMDFLPPASFNTLQSLFTSIDLKVFVVDKLKSNQPCLVVHYGHTQVLYISQEYLDDGCLDPTDESRETAERRFQKIQLFFQYLGHDANLLFASEDSPSYYRQLSPSISTLFLKFVKHLFPRCVAIENLASNTQSSPLLIYPQSFIDKLHKEHRFFVHSRYVSTRFPKGYNPNPFQIPINDTTKNYFPPSAPAQIVFKKPEYKKYGATEFGSHIIKPYTLAELDAQFLDAKHLYANSENQWDFFSSVKTRVHPITKEPLFPLKASDSFSEAHLRFLLIHQIASNIFKTMGYQIDSERANLNKTFRRLFVTILHYVDPQARLYHSDQLLCLHANIREGENPSQFTISARDKVSLYSLSLGNFSMKEMQFDSHFEWDRNGIESLKTPDFLYISSPEHELKLPFVIEPLRASTPKYDSENLFQLDMRLNQWVKTHPQQAQKIIKNNYDIDFNRIAHILDWTEKEVRILFYGTSVFPDDFVDWIISHAELLQQNKEMILQFCSEISSQLSNGHRFKEIGKGREREEAGQGIQAYFAKEVAFLKSTFFQLLHNQTLKTIQFLKKSPDQFKMALITFAGQHRLGFLAEDKLSFFKFTTNPIQLENYKDDSDHKRDPAREIYKQKVLLPQKGQENLSETFFWSYLDYPHHPEYVTVSSSGLMFVLSMLQLLSTYTTLDKNSLLHKKEHQIQMIHRLHLIAQKFEGEESFLHLLANKLSSTFLAEYLIDSLNKTVSKKKKAHHVTDWAQFINGHPESQQFKDHLDSIRLIGGLIISWIFNQNLKDESQIQQQPIPSKKTLLWNSPDYQEYAGNNPEYNRKQLRAICNQCPDPLFTFKETIINSMQANSPSIHLTFRLLESPKSKTNKIPQFIVVRDDQGDGLSYPKRYAFVTPAGSHGEGKQESGEAKNFGYGLKSIWSQRGRSLQIWTHPKKRASQNDSHTSFSLHFSRDFDSKEFNVYEHSVGSDIPYEDVLPFQYNSNRPGTRLITNEMGDFLDMQMAMYRLKEALTIYPFIDIYINGQAISSPHTLFKTNKTALVWVNQIPQTIPSTPLPVQQLLPTNLHKPGYNTLRIMRKHEAQTATRSYTKSLPLNEEEMKKSLDTLVQMQIQSSSEHSKNHPLHTSSSPHISKQDSAMFDHIFSIYNPDHIFRLTNQLQRTSQQDTIHTHPVIQNIKLLSQEYQNKYTQMRKNFISTRNKLDYAKGTLKSLYEEQKSNPSDPDIQDLISTYQEMITRFTKSFEEVELYDEQMSSQIMEEYKKILYSYYPHEQLDIVLPLVFNQFQEQHKKDEAYRKLLDYLLSLAQNKQLAPPLIEFLWMKLSYYYFGESYKKEEVHFDFMQALLSASQTDDDVIDLNKEDRPVFLPSQDDTPFTSLPVTPKRTKQIRQLPIERQVPSDTPPPLIEEEQTPKSNYLSSLLSAFTLSLKSRIPPNSSSKSA